MMMTSTSKVANNVSVGENRNRITRSSPIKSPQPNDGEQMIKVVSKKPTKSQREQVPSPCKIENVRCLSFSPIKQTDRNTSCSVEKEEDNCTSTPSNSSIVSKTCNCKYNTQQILSLRQKEKELEKLRKDLAKCQNELREEVEKRGSSSSARAVMDRERARLLNEIKELGVSKRRLESALEEASSALKKKTQEVRLVKEECKQQVAALEKSANLETKKLLEDLKAKDHLLAILDRNQYSDRTNQIKILQVQRQQQEKNSSPTPDDSAMCKCLQTAPSSNVAIEQQSFNKHPRKGEGTIQEEITILKKKIDDLELQLNTTALEKGDLEKQNKDILVTKQNLEATISRLRDDNRQLNSDLNAVQFEVKRLNESLSKNNVEEMIDQFERLRSTNDMQKSLIKKLQRQIKQSKKKEKSQTTKVENSKKTVRFMLPGYTEPIVNGRIAFKEDLKFLFEEVHDDDDDDEIQFYFEAPNSDDDDDAGGDDDDANNNNNATVESDSDDDDRVTTGDDVTVVGGEDEDNSEQETPPTEIGDYKMLMKEHLVLEQTVANLSQAVLPHSWVVEKESLQLALMALEKKNQEYETMIDKLKGKIEEMKEKNEELEFQVLEFEGSGNDALTKEQDLVDFALIDKNHKLEEEIKTLQDQLLQSSFQQVLPDDECSPNILVLKNDAIDAEIQCAVSIDEDMDKECDQISCSETAFISSTSSGFDDLSSDEENSFESFPRDEKPAMVISAEDHSTQSSKPSEEYLMKLVESLETRLACSRLREIQLQDKLALLCEEKNRIIRDFDKYAGSDVDSLLEVDSAIMVDCSEDGSVVESDDHRLTKIRSSQLKLDLCMEFGRFSHHDDSILAETPTSAELCFPKNVQSLTVEDETDVLHQRVCHLEKDCELLREIIDMDEGIIRDLQVKVDELESSEKNLSKIVDRLETVEKVLRASESSALEENSRLKVELSRSRSVEENLQSQLNMTRCDKSQLKHKLEEVLEELKQTETRLKKKTSDSERDKKTSTAANEKLEDHVGELEAVVELLKRRNQNLQRLCEDTNMKLIDTENHCKRYKAQMECMEQQRDAFVARIQTMEKEKSIVAEKFNIVAKDLSERVSELEMARIEIKGLRACLNSSEEEVRKWMKKAEDRADVEVLLMREMQELRFENESLEEKLRSEVTEMLSATKRQKCSRPHMSIETQTDPSITIFVDKCDQNDEETLMPIDDDDDDDDVASMDDASEGSELDQEGFPLDDESSKEPRLKVDRISTGKWGSLDSLWCKLGIKNNSFGNSKVFRDKFTQTLIPLVPYLRRMHAASLVRNKLDSSKSAVGASMIPLSEKYFSQSNSPNFYASRPPMKMIGRVSPCHQDVKTGELDNLNVAATSLLDSNAPVHVFDLLSESVSVLQNCNNTRGPSDGPVRNLRSPGPCASQ